MYFRKTGIPEYSHRHWANIRAMLHCLEGRGKVEQLLIERNKHFGMTSFLDTSTDWFTDLDVTEM